ncbi:MAG: hypothetical protein K2N12_00955 [Helicobacter sp.]|nr:hypothetical protein [Helicobacter sp.]
MTITLKNVDSATLQVIESLQALNPKLTIEKGEEKEEFSLLREKMKQNLNKPQNRAVFERLKDK